jgi:Aldehyde dehydrogenase family
MTDGRPTATTSSGAVFRSLRSRNYRLWFTGQTVSMTEYFVQGVTTDVGPRHEHWIGGKPVEPVGGTYLPTLDPATREPGDDIAAGSAADVDLAGQVTVNGGALTIETPFGGFKPSGYGREKGLEALHEYAQAKSVNLSLH